MLFFCNLWFLGQWDVQYFFVDAQAHFINILKGFGSFTTHAGYVALSLRHHMVVLLTKFPDVVPAPKTDCVLVIRITALKHVANMSPAPAVIAF